METTACSLLYSKNYLKALLALSVKDVLNSFVGLDKIVYESDAIVVDLDVITFIPKVLSILEWL
jgi:hypothetical protein